MYKHIFSLITCAALAPVAGAATSLITLDFGDSTNPTGFATGGDVVANNWNPFGTAAGNNFVEFNDGSFDVTNATADPVLVTPVTMTTSFAGTAGGAWTSGIGDPTRVDGSGNPQPVPGIGVWRADGGSGTPQGTENGQWGNTPGTNEFALSVSFDQPVVLQDVKANWWDGGTDSGSWQISASGQTGINDGTLNTENSTKSLVTDLGFTSQTVGGVTGVFLPAGSTILFEDNNVLLPSGDAMDNGLLQGLTFYVVPEPSLSILTLLGIFGLGLRRRR